MQKAQEKSGEPVRLNDNLLFSVNKKLQAKDKAARDEKISSFSNVPHLGRLQPSKWPFTEVSYRKKSSQNLSQAQLAVMHGENFKSTSTLVVSEDNSMDNFIFKIQMASKYIQNPDYKNFLRYHKRDAGAKVQNPVARFVQLPTDYLTPEEYDFCAFFPELAWKE